MRPTYGQLRKVQEVFFHESCPDGTAAAMICAAALRRAGVSAKFHAMQYDTEFMDRLEPRPGQLFVDITPPRARWRDWIGAAPIVLDHHESAREVTEGLDGVYGLNETHSGAMLAYDHVYLTVNGSSPTQDPDVLEWQSFATLAMIRDTWKKGHALWDDACAHAMALSTFGSRTMLEKVNATGTVDFGAVMELGRILLESARRKAEYVADRATPAKVSDGTRTLRVSLFNCTEKILSDAANLLVDRGDDVAVGYFYTFEDGEQRLVVSIRTSGVVSAAAIAQVFGGGGHDRAAGFRISSAADTPPSTVLSYLENGVKAALQAR